MRNKCSPGVVTSPRGKALASRIALQELEVQLSGMTCPATVHNTGTVLHLGESY